MSVNSNFSPPFGSLGAGFPAGAANPLLAGLGGPNAVNGAGFGPAGTQQQAAGWPGQAGQMGFGWAGQPGMDPAMRRERQRQLILGGVALVAVTAIVFVIVLWSHLSTANASLDAANTNLNAATAELAQDQDTLEALTACSQSAVDLISAIQSNSDLNAPLTAMESACNF